MSPLVGIMVSTAIILVSIAIATLIIKQIISKLITNQQAKNSNMETIYSHVSDLLSRQEKSQIEQNAKNNEQFHRTMSTLQQSIKLGLDEIRQQLQLTLKQNSDFIEKQMQNLTKTTENKLTDIGGQVDKRLNDGFEQTTQIFQNVIKRLTIIDEAQKEIVKLSGDVVSLQDILNDKRSRGAFGEVQLVALIRNLIPENNFKLQATLSNGKRVDCLLLLPEPTGSISVDAKFPLENYKAFINCKSTDSNYQNLRSQFRQSVKKHIDDIASKYIIPGETADGSILFIPAEAVFAEIHANFYELVEYAQKNKVWLASPTTMMAILTTSLAAIKDVETKKQIHIIQKHLGLLSIDFTRFQKRIDNLARHIRQAEEDVTQIHQSSKKITARFTQIERVELEQLD
ncbi:MAG: DNA recombination protein RmuC [Legionellales bacterium]|jgi:DNA recombination protein RmuC|nr:DNA recombination protein RmuC [Legionellales bacterium]